MLLQTDSDKGECFVETKDLDGETNLKRKETHQDIPRPSTAIEFGDDNFRVLEGKVGTLEFDLPNNDLEKFQGALTVDGRENKIPLMNKHLLLRGCTLRNSTHAIGVVVYCGHDTKVMKNTGAARFKRTHVDKQMNMLVLVILGLLIFFSAMGSVINAVWLNDVGSDFHESYNWYYTKTINFEDQDGNFDLDFNKREKNPAMIALLNFFSYFIVMNTLIPISLYVSIEFIRLGQSLLISFDPLMWDTKVGAYAMARSTTLSEELGQIDYVFSDKTGTLTQNVMVFKRCCVKDKATQKCTIFGADGTGEEIAELSTRIRKDPKDADANVWKARYGTFLSRYSLLQPHSLSLG